MPTNNKIKLLQELKRNPSVALLNYIKQLEQSYKEEVERIRSEAKEEVAEAIKQAKTDAIFGESDEAKKVAQREARAEIASFQTDIKNKMDTVVKNLDKAEKEVVERVNQQIATIDKKFQGDVESVLKKVKDVMSEQEGQHKMSFGILVDNVKAEVSRAVNKVKTMVDNQVARIEDLRGPQGVPGPKGKDGKDGSPDTAEQIAKKLNKKEKIVDWKALKNIPFEVLNRGGSSRGGGGDTMVFDDLTSQCDGSNKTFTLTRKARDVNKFIVQGTDFPIILRPTTDFTVTGTTLTLTAAVPAPQSGATLIAFYAEG